MKTPCEKLGYKVGDRFIKVGKDDGVFTNGSVIELSRDDGSECPLFKLVSGECSFSSDKAYEDLCYVKKLIMQPSCLQAENEELKEEIKRLKLENRELTERRKEIVSMCDQLMAENTNLRELIAKAQGEFYPCKPDIFAETYVGEWISVKTALPKDRDLVLTWDGQSLIELLHMDRSDIGPNHKYGWHIPHTDKSYHPVMVTHWMPLPMPPKE